MVELTWLIPALPLPGFLVLSLFGRLMSEDTAGIVGAGSVGLSLLATVLVATGFADYGQSVFLQELWTWIEIGDFKTQIAFRLDSLSLVMAGVVAFVGFLIHIYSLDYMRGEEGYARFFAYMNLFVAMMFTLVLADNLLLLYLGWEGVGLCSYLLIGFWYRDPENGRAARKAFVVTRIGDAAMAVGLFLLVMEFSTLDLFSIARMAPQAWTAGSPMATLVALLLLGGAIGKSAQLPLQVWLPDAMAGPTPVSALIHAATMVTAGVYLLVRLHAIVSLSPLAMTLIAAIGAATLLIAGLAALGQRDIKRVLAYSTISQLGYMFVAVGVAAWSAAIFHLMTHAFFKALLFLGAGAVIHETRGEHDIFEMGGLKEKLPVTFWTFLIASASLAGLPLVTAGFYSKDLIISRAWTGANGSAALWAVALAGVFVTGLYVFRVVFVAFYGEARGDGAREAESEGGWKLLAPMVVLALLSVIGGFVWMPHTLGGFAPFADFLHTTLPAPQLRQAALSEAALQIASGVTALVGIAAAWGIWGRGEASEASEHAVTRAAGAGFGFDGMYRHLVARPYVALARLNRDDFIDVVFDGVSRATKLMHRTLASTQTGHIRTYAAAMVLGALLLIGAVMVLG